MLASGLLIGCGGTARIYQQDTNSATFVLEGVEEKALDDAHKKMAAHCGARGYHLVKRDTVVVGKENYSSERTDYEEDEDTSVDRNTISESQNESEHEYSGGGSEGSVETNDYGPDYHDKTTASGSEYSGGGSSADHSIETTGEAEDTHRATEGSTQTDRVEGTRNVNEKRITFACGAG